MEQMEILICHNNRDEYELHGELFKHMYPDNEENMIDLIIRYSHSENLPDYCGVMSSSEYLCFIDEDNQKKPKRYKEIYMMDTLANQYGLERHSIEKHLENTDGLIAKMRRTQGKKYYTREWSEDFHDYYWHYLKVKAASLELHEIRTVVAEVAPVYLDSFDSFIANYKACSQLDFVFDKDSFVAYCRFAEDVLTLINPYNERTKLSYNNMSWKDEIAKILLGVYVAYKKSECKIIRECNTIKVKNRGKYELPMPAFQENNNVIVAASSDKNVSHVGVWLQSCMDYFSESNNYDVIILESEITDKNKARLLSMTSGKNNVSLRFINPSPFLGNAIFNNAVKKMYGQEIYYRLFTPWLLKNFDKIIMIDTDIIVKADLAELYSIDMKGKSLAWTFEIGYLGIMNRWQWRYEYTKYNVGMEKPYAYSNAGVMVLNLEKIRGIISKQQMIDKCKNQHYLISDQDILNDLFKNDYTFMDPMWNFHALMENQDERWSVIYKNCPRKELEQYHLAENNAKILHYVGIPKPWEDPSVCFGEEFWIVARRTCFYEDLLTDLYEYRKKSKKEKKKKAKEEKKIKKGRNKVLVMDLFPNEFDKIAEQIKGVNTEKISAYKNIHKGERCFFIGTGPSLQISDLDRLKGEYAFAFNNVFPLFEKTDWRPDFYLFDDLGTWKSLQKKETVISNILKWKLANAFVPASEKALDSAGLAVNYLPVINVDAKYRRKDLNADNVTVFYSKDCENRIYSVFEPMYAGMQLATYMGFSEIYLLGCDARYEEPYAHCYERDKDLEDIEFIGANKSKKRTNGMNKSFLLMNYAARILNMRIYNVTRGGYLTIFPRIAFDTLNFSSDK